MGILFLRNATARCVLHAPVTGTLAGTRRNAPHSAALRGGIACRQLSKTQNDTGNQRHVAFRPAHFRNVITSVLSRSRRRVCAPRFVAVFRRKIRPETPRRTQLSGMSYFVTPVARNLRSSGPPMGVPDSNPAFHKFPAFYHIELPRTL